MQLHRDTSLCLNLGLSREAARTFSTQLDQLVEEDSSYDSSACPSPSELLQPVSPQAPSALPTPVAPSSPQTRVSSTSQTVVLAVPLAVAPGMWLVVRTKYGLNHTSVALFDRTVLDLSCEVREGFCDGPLSSASYEFQLSVVNCLGSRLQFPVRAANMPEQTAAPFSIQGNPATTRLGSSANYSFRVGPTALYAEFHVSVNGERHSFGTTVRNGRARSEDWHMEVLSANHNSSVLRLQSTTALWEFSLTTVAQSNCANVPSTFEVHRPREGRYAYLVPAGWRGVIAAVPTPNGAVHLYFLPTVASFLGGVGVSFGAAVHVAPVAPVAPLQSTKRARDA